MSQRRILIVDDHSELRRVMRELLTDRVSDVEIGEAADGDEACRLVARDPWHLVLLDLSLGSQRGLDTLRRLKQIRSEVPVLIMSLHPEDKYRPAALALGAAGYLMKGADPGAIVSAVDRALAPSG
jgi:two-component system invasion response regulator UvrY